MSNEQYHLILNEIAGLRKRQNMMLLLICAMILWLASVTFASDKGDAVRDRSQNVPREQWIYTYYFGLGHLPESQREQVSQALAFAVCSLNTRVVIERQVPVQVDGHPNIYRINTTDLGWEKTLPVILRRDYPYTLHPHSHPLVIRADWFIQYALDQEVSGDTYFELLFGKVPKDLDELLAFLKVDRKSEYEFGHIEDDSGVAVNKTRLVTTVPTSLRSDVWITYDFAILDDKSDPLEHLDRKFKYDANEIIAALPKSSSRTGSIGHLQVYALSSDKGELQAKAPADIVTDSTEVRGVEIRNAVSCIVCHPTGLNPLKNNALRAFIRSGAEVYTEYENRELIERFHLTSLNTLIARHNEDYATAILAINGLTPEQNNLAFRNVIRSYDAPLTLAAAAQEFFIPEKEFKLALGFGGALPARVSQLAHGVPIARTIWEANFRTVFQAVVNWRKATK